MNFQKLIFTFYFLIFFQSFNLLEASEIKTVAEKLITKEFTNKINLIFQNKWDLEKDLKKQIEKKTRQAFLQKHIFSWKITYTNKILSNKTIIKNKVEKYVLLDHVYGKLKPITFCVIFNSDATIYSTLVIKYREHYGMEIKSKGWLKQFINLSIKDIPLHPKKIDQISGATISVKSYMKGVSKLVLLFPHYLKHKTKEKK